MADSTRAQIEQAYNLIQKEQLDQAITILRQVVAKEPKNVDAWWLMANAVSEPADAFEALSNVLQLAPNHVEARAAYDQLIQEFPELAPKKPAAATQDSGDFSADISVDIDDLLRRTGALDSRRNEPLKRPEGATDVSDAYLDQAWDQQQDKAKEPETLEDLFGSDVANVQATPTEDEDLAALFTGQSAAPATQQKPTGTAQGGDLEDLFGGNGAALEPAAAAEDMNLDDFFGGAAAEATASPEADLESMFGTAPGEAAQPAPAGEPQEVSLDEFFAPAQPAASTQPAASGGLYESDPFAGREPAFVGDVAPTAPTRPVEKPRRERAPKPTPVIQEAKPPDPFAVERRANRRSRVRIILGLLVAIAILVGGIFLYLQLTKPDPVTVAMQGTTQDLTDNGFAEVATTRSGDAIQVTVCGVAGPGLQARVYQAMDLIASRIVTPDVRNTVKSAQIEVNTCGKADVKLYRATATMGVLAGYIDSGKADARAYHAGWQRN